MTAFLQAGPTFTSPPPPLPLPPNLNLTRCFHPQGQSLPSCCHGHQPRPEHTSHAVPSLWLPSRQMQSSWGRKLVQGCLEGLSPLSAESSPSVLLAAGSDWAVIVPVSPCTGFSGASDPNLLELNKAVPRAQEPGWVPNTGNGTGCHQFTSLKSEESGEKCGPGALLEREIPTEKPKKHRRIEVDSFQKQGQTRPCIPAETTAVPGVMLTQACFTATAAARPGEGPAVHANTANWQLSLPG